jgi:hypothetical protein
VFGAEYQLDGDVSFLSFVCLPRVTGFVLIAETFANVSLPQVQTHPHPPPAVRPRAHRARERVDDELLLVRDAAGSQCTLDGEKFCKLTERERIARGSSCSSVMIIILQVVMCGKTR